jgi:NADPH:quinone reductase-like Zn-dependent oxidoreductase
MKAITLKNFGGAENLIQTEISLPLISEGEVMLRVSAFSINPVDIKTRNGKGVASQLKDTDPMILGWDFSGTVYETGRDVSLFKKGDDVFGMVNFPGPGKTYAEFIAANPLHLALKPTNISHAEAAGASLAALTAWQVLKNLMRIKKGDRILIHSAAGGVGHYAVQMAKHLGAWVAGTASGGNRDFILSLGASEHIDYEKDRFEDAINGFDYVLDSIGGEYIDRSLRVLKPGGTIVTIPSAYAGVVKEKAAAKGMKGEPFSVRPNGINMREIAGMLEKGILRSHISRTFGFEEIREAHHQIETGKTRGKIVVIL